MRIFLHLATVLFAGLFMGLTLPALAQPPADLLDAAADPGVQASPSPAETEIVEAESAGPSPVSVGVYINDIQSIDLTTHSFVADLYIWFRDHDPDIVPGLTFEMMNMFAPNDHMRTALYDGPQPQPDGSDYELFRHQGPFTAKFSIRTYPFDTHDLAIEIEDAEWTSRRLVYVVDEVLLNPDIHLPGFVIGQPSMQIASKPYPTAFGDLANPEIAPYSRVVVSVSISRPLLSGLLKTFLPIFIVVLVAAAALLVDPSHVEPRFGLSITALLTLVALQFSAMANLPEVGYLLMLDQLYLASYAYVLLVVGLVVVSTASADAAERRGDASAARSGWPATLVSVSVYAAAVAVILYVNLGELLSGVS